MSDSDKFDVKSLFKLPKVVRSGEVNPHKYKMLDADLAAFPGQPSITFGDSANEVFIGVSPAPMIGMDYLLTWNCKHIANAQIQGKLAEISLDFGYELPILCTPYELLGG